MSLYIDLGYNGFPQLIAFVFHFIIVYYIFEAFAYTLAFIQNLWIRYNITMDIIVVSLIGAYLYFVMNLYFGYVTTIMLIIGSVLYFSANYIPSTFTTNFLTLFFISFLFFEHTEQFLLRCYILLYSILHHVYIVCIVSFRFLTKNFF